jgi:hypothetical protein
LFYIEDDEQGTQQPGKASDYIDEEKTFIKGR